MILYRLVDWCSSPPEYGYRMDEENSPSVEKCYVDVHSLECLEKLVTGPVKKPDDLFAAEMAIRAIVFHDTIQYMSPAYKENYVFDINQAPSTLFHSEGEIAGVSFPAIQDVTKHAKWSGFISPVDHQIFCFNDEESARKFIDRHDQRRKIINEQESIREQKSKGQVIKPTFWIDYSKGKFEFLANSREEYFQNIYRQSDKLIKTFLQEIPKTAKAAYFSDKLYRKYIEQIQKHNPKQFFDSIDEDWRQVQKDVLNYIVKIPIQPLLAIVMDRATTRSNIPKEIIAIREELQDARNQLWEHFDEARLRSPSFRSTMKLLQMIEKEAKQIVPKAFKTSEPIFPFTFQFFRRLLMMDYVGLSDDVLGLVQKGAKSSFHLVSAAAVPGAT